MLEVNHKPNKDGKHTLFLRISENRKMVRIALGYSIELKYFNKKSHSLRSGCPNASIIQEKFKLKKEELEKFELDSNKRGQIISLNVLKGLATESKYHNFYEYAEKQIARWRKTKSVNHVKHVESVIENLKLYANNKDLNFEDFSIPFLKDLEAHYVDSGNKSGTVRNKLKNLRTIFLEAEEERLISMEANPFRRFKMPKFFQEKKEKLSIEEIKSIIALEIPVFSPLWHVRNAFLFAFYNAGIRVSDVIMLRWESIKGERLVYKMKKNQKWCDLNLRKEAWDILENYMREDIKPSDFVFPFFKNNVEYKDKYFLELQLSSKTAQINERLKKIAKLAEIEKNLSFHIARHSFASIAMKNISIDKVSSLLNHSSIKITENYLASLGQEEKDKALNEALNF